MQLLAISKPSVPIITITRKGSVFKRPTYRNNRMNAAPIMVASDSDESDDSYDEVVLPRWRAPVMEPPVEIVHFTEDVFWEKMWMLQWKNVSEGENDINNVRRLQAIIAAGDNFQNVYCAVYHNIYEVISAAGLFDGLSQQVIEGVTSHFIAKGREFCDNVLGDIYLCQLIVENNEYVSFHQLLPKHVQDAVRNM